LISKLTFIFVLITLEWLWQLRNRLERTYPCSGTTACWSTRHWLSPPRKWEIPPARCRQPNNSSRSWSILLNCCISFNSC